MDFRVCLHCFCYSGIHSYLCEVDKMHNLIFTFIQVAELFSILLTEEHFSTYTQWFVLAVLVIHCYDSS